jgi:hypothetical protein
LMMDEIDDLLENRLVALQEMEREKLKVARLYNKRVKEKSFQVSELVWKTILPLGAWDRKFGKWSWIWDGPFTVARVVTGNVYFIKSLEGEALHKVASTWKGSSLVYGRVLENVLQTNEIEGRFMKESWP